MKNTFLALVLITMGLINQGCTGNAALRAHKTQIKQVSNNPEMAEIEKFDAVMQTVSEVLEEGFEKGSPSKTYLYLRKFEKQNSNNLKQLVSEFDAWQQDMNILEKGVTLAHVSTQPYTRKLITQMPKLVKMTSEGDYKLKYIDKLLLKRQLKEWGIW